MNLPLKKRSLSISLTLIGWGSWMLLESGGGWKSFLKVLDKLGKVTKFGTSRPLFHGEMDGWKKYELIQPPPPYRVKKTYLIAECPCAQKVTMQKMSNVPVLRNCVPDDKLIFSWKASHFLDQKELGLPLHFYQLHIHQ